MNQAERFAKIVSTLKRCPGVTLGSAKKGFGSSALCVGGKIFAMISSKGSFVVKLPKERVDALVTSGDGGRFEPARGRVMKEWFVLDPDSELDGLSLAREAMAFVASKSS